MANIFTIPATAPFLDHLARAILDGDLPAQGGPKPDHLDLPKITLLLPTRRSCRQMREAFLRMAPEKATLLPRILPLGEQDEDRGLVHELKLNPQTELVLDQLPPAISPTERHLALSQFVLTWFKSELPVGLETEHLPGSRPEPRPAEASLMAKELAKLMDNAETEEIDLGKLKTLVPDRFSTHWQKTLHFLQIILDTWPDYLTSTGEINPCARRNRLITAETDHLLEMAEQGIPPSGPIIAAGSTGSQPATQRLLKAIAMLDEGAIVLPGLDFHLDEESWKLLAAHPEHPQSGLAHLLKRLEIKRQEVRPLLHSSKIDSAQQTRLQFISEVMRPASTTQKWQDYMAAVDSEALTHCLKNTHLFVAPTAQDEAEMVALMLREVAETPGKRGALITSDRILARRVVVRLEEWGLRIDDSGGRPLAKTVPGSFLDAIITCLQKQFSPESLCALLKHPLTQLGFEGGRVRLAARALEIAALHGPWLGGGLKGVVQNFQRARQDLEKRERQHISIKRLSDDEWDLAETLLQKLQQGFEPLLQLTDKPLNDRSGQTRELKTFIEAHIAVGETLSQDSEGQSQHLWSGEAGEQLGLLLADYLMTSIGGPELEWLDYPEFYRSLIAGETVRPLTAVHPRLFIWGPFEARLQHCDRVILGGMNEGVWPQTSKTDPWLSRPMRKELGLPSPEQHIGFAAHDFCQGLAAPEVYLTRAAKMEGVETVPSRWIMRMEALLRGAKVEQALESLEGVSYLDWALERDQVEIRPPLTPPSPKPPLSARPRRMSVTQIESWITNPYSIFARHILSLQPLEPLAMPPDHALKGTIVHKVMQKFTEYYPASLPVDLTPQQIEQDLISLAEEELVKFGHYPLIAGFWLPKFRRFAKWFSTTEIERRHNIRSSKSEIDGRIDIELPRGIFTLTARADRIDVDGQGCLHIYDYKTGSVPNWGWVKDLRAPQLPLEAAIANKGGFKDLTAATVASLRYIAAKGSNPAGREDILDDCDIDQMAEQALKNLQKLINEFDNVDTPYMAQRRSQFKDKYRYDQFAHLARVDEWGIEQLGGRDNGS